MGAWERIAVNVDAVYRELDPSYPAADIFELFMQMAEIAAPPATAL